MTGPERETTRGWLGGLLVVAVILACLFVAAQLAGA